MAVDLRGRTIIITGASSGIGAATALECAKAGMDVVISARRADRLQAVAEEIERLDRRVVIVVGDVDEEGMSQRLLDAADEQFGGFFAVFANAGFGQNIPAVQEEEADLRRIFDVNFFASMRLIRLAGERLLERRQPGHLLMCSSCLSKFALPDHGAYSATKAAQNAMCSAMRLELEADGIAVSSVHPITTTTEFFEASRRISGGAPPPVQPDHTPSFLVQSPRRVARAVVKRLRKPRGGEVWTSLLVRSFAGVITAFPALGDAAIRMQVRKEMRDLRANAGSSRSGS